MGLKTVSEPLRDGLNHVPTVPKANLGLRRVNVDVHILWRHSDLQHNDRVAPLRNNVPVRFTHRTSHQCIPYIPTVHKEVHRSPSGTLMHTNGTDQGLDL